MATLINAQGRLAAMLLLTTIFFMVEIIVGYITNSMALIADSFHMFSDAIALVIAFVSVRMSPKKWSKNTFGWARAEILGALVNAVFLCALCISILIESVKRFIKPDLIHDPHLLGIVGALGLFINLIGLFLFKEHGHLHSHGHLHNHGHHQHTHKHSHATQENEFLVCQGDTLKHTVSPAERIKYGLLSKHHDHSDIRDYICKTARNSHSPPLDNRDVCEEDRAVNVNHVKGDLDEDNYSTKLTMSNPTDKVSPESQIAFRPTSSSKHHHSRVDLHTHDDSQKAKNHPTSNQMNMRGVFLHVLADALGSVVVMISALVVIYTDESRAIRLYIDPTLSVFMVCLILRSTWPLLTESAMILLQTVPTHIEVDSLRRRLTEEIPGVLAVHEFHVWQLAGDRIIASAHIRCHNLQDYMRIAERVKEFFHNEGIHSTTIQPEFIDIDNHIHDSSDHDNCVLDCPRTQRPHCAPQTCCGNQQKDAPTSEPSSNVAIDCGENAIDQAGTLLRRTNITKANQSESNDSKDGQDANQAGTHATTV